MKKILGICTALMLFVSCSEDIVIDPPLNNDFALIVKNGTHDDIMVESKQLSVGIITLPAEALSDTLYTSSEEVTLDYFGKGTYWKQKKCTVSLERNRVTEVVLKN